MKTCDKDKLTALLEDFGVEYTYNTTHPSGNLMIICTQGSDKVVGYTGFLTEFTFNSKGEFVRMGAWE